MTVTQTKDVDETNKQGKSEEKGSRFLMPLIWSHIISITTLHVIAIITLCIFPYMQCWRTFIFSFVMGNIAGFGVTAGAHRYWCHRSFKAILPLRIIFMLCYCAAGQNTLLEWVRDHRVHHKYSETLADPHNSNRGFFFAHVGWLMMKKHPEVLKKGRSLDYSDLWEDPVFVFHEKYSIPLRLLCCIILPTIIPPVFWGESWGWSLLSQITRYVITLNITWSVNSAAHMWGNKPYDKRINPAENLSVAILALGEGWHNYHHTFPWDYRAAEHGFYSVNMTTMWLDLFAKFGWVYDLKVPTKKLITTVIEKHGDGTYFTIENHLNYNAEEKSM